jgi:hypothetical protein
VANHGRRLEISSVALKRMAIEIKFIKFRSLPGNEFVYFKSLLKRNNHEVFSSLDGCKRYMAS